MSASTTAAVEAVSVSKSYGGYRIFGRNKPLRYALRDVSFSIRAGETWGLLGPNGAGKTTLLKILATLLSPTSGTVRVNGFDVVEQSRDARRSLGLVTSDERSFYWRLTGRQNLRFFAALYGLPHQLAEERITMLLEVLGLTYAADRQFLGYSSGMKQKLAIARGLMNEPRVVLYDEPTRALDPLSAQSIRHWIQENRSPMQAHLLATNQLYEAEQLCERVMIINRGTVIALGTIEQIREDFRKHDYAVHRISFRGAASIADIEIDPDLGLFDATVETVEDGVTTVKLRTRHEGDALNYALRTIIDRGGQIEHCDSEEVPFDDIFCALVLGDKQAAAAAEATR